MKYVLVLVVLAVATEAAFDGTVPRQEPATAPIVFTLVPGPRGEKPPDPRIRIGGGPGIVDIGSAPEHVTQVPAAARARRDPGVQYMMASIESIDVPPAGSSGVARRNGWPRVAASLAWAPSLTPISEIPRTRAIQPLTMFVASLGVSTGEALELHVINDSPAPVTLTGAGVVVEPLERGAQQAVRSELQRLLRRNPTVVRLDAYCLEFLRQPPSAGLMLRIADQSLQRQFAPMRRILEASGHVREAGMLRPDSDPAGYFHFIRQWAIWTREQQFTADTFREAWIDHTKQLIQEAGGALSAPDEEVLRRAAPGRWHDITEVLRLAEAMSNHEP